MTETTSHGQTIQVDASHYVRPGYLFPERWASYWHQIDAVRGLKPSRLLEIGIGNGIVAHALAKLGMTVDTLDIDPALHPTMVGSVTKIPAPDASYDVVLCAELLEHLPWEEFKTALAEITRVSKKHVIITVPHAGYVFSLLFKVPFLAWVRLGFKVPQFFKTHAFNGQHYWETGKKGFSRARIRRAVETGGLRILDARIHPDDPAHYCLICEKI